MRVLHDQPDLNDGLLASGFPVWRIKLTFVANIDAVVGQLVHDEFDDGQRGGAARSRMSPVRSHGGHDAACARSHQ